MGHFSRLLFLLLLGLSALSFGQLTQEPVYAVHPHAKAPIYLPAAWAEKIKAEVPAFPEKGSPEQKKDEEALVQYQNKRKSQDCERATSEIHLTLASMYGKPYGSLDDKEVQALTSFFDKVRNDGDYFTHQVKEKYSRPRPFTYLKELHPCVELEKSFAYPSGHSSLSQLFALVLGEIFPSRKQSFLERAKQVREDRVLAGVHHPSDIEGGKVAGELIFAELMKSDTFKKDLEAAKQQVHSKKSQ